MLLREKAVITQIPKKIKASLSKTVRRTLSFTRPYDRDIATVERKKKVRQAWNIGMDRQRERRGKAAASSPSGSDDDEAAAQEPRFGCRRGRGIKNPRGRERKFPDGGTRKRRGAQNGKYGKGKVVGGGRGKANNSTCRNQ